MAVFENSLRDQTDALEHVWLSECPLVNIKQELIQLKQFCNQENQSD